MQCVFLKYVASSVSLLTDLSCPVIGTDPPVPADMLINPQRCCLSSVDAAPMVSDQRSFADGVSGSCIVSGFAFLDDMVNCGSIPEPITGSQTSNISFQPCPKDSSVSSEGLDDVMSSRWT